MRCVVLLFCLCVCYSLGYKLPIGFKKCNKKEDGFNQCIAKAVEVAVHSLRKPIKKLGIPSFEPLTVKNITVIPNGGIINFEQNFTYLSIYKLTTGQVKKFDIDFNTNEVQMEFNFPELIYEFDFSFNGTVMAIPLVGTGFGRVIMEKPTYNLTFLLDDYVKYGQKYYKVVYANLEMNAARLITKLENFFAGDKVWEARVNKIFNDNWDLIFDQAKNNYEIILGRYFAAIFNNILTRVPAVDLFGAE